MARTYGIYKDYLKRFLDILCSLAAIIVFGWLYIIIALLVRFNLGSPVLFCQPRPGMIDPQTGQERIFMMYKFRTMTDAKDENGNLRPDEERLTAFGRKLRATSLDELPEAFNILKGDMSIIGPRPQLVRDMVFMSDEVRKRHTVRPGLSGLAQVNGRNEISWEEKFKWDLQYIDRISFSMDLRILWQTFKNVFLRKDMTQEDEQIRLSDDYGDYLLKMGDITLEEYNAIQRNAKALLEGNVKYR